MVKPRGHSKSQIYNNHDKTATDIPSGYEYVAEQIADAKRHVKALNMHLSIMRGEGPGDITNMPKGEQQYWHNVGTRGETFSSWSQSNVQYDRTVRKGISKEYSGFGMRAMAVKPSDGYRVAQEAKLRKKKRIS